MRIHPDSLGLGDLARVCAQVARRVGSHGLGNVFLRKGEGRPYEAVLADAAKGKGVPMEGIEQTELAVLRAHFSERWDQLDPGSRAQLWADLGIDGVAPEVGVEAVTRAHVALGRALGYRIAGVAKVVTHPAGLLTISGILMHPVGCLFRPFLAIGAPLLAWYKLRPNEDLVLAVVLEVARLRQIVLHRVTLGVVGSPSTGKDAAIRALFGIDSGNISPVAGSTKEVTIQRLPGATALYVVNTPGMGDVVERVTEEARQVLDHIDLYLYIVNAEGGVQARELADFQACRRSGKPVLAVVNKVDVLRPRDRDAYLADARKKLGAAEEDFLPVAFDPLPQLSDRPIGLEQVHAWMRRRLEELGKDPVELPELPRVSVAL